MTQKIANICILQKISSRGEHGEHICAISPNPLLTIGQEDVCILSLGVLHNFQAFHANLRVLRIFCAIFFWGKKYARSIFLCFLYICTSFLSSGRYFTRTHPVCRLPCATPGPCPDLFQFHINHDMIIVSTNKSCTAKKGLKFISNLHEYFRPYGRIKHWHDYHFNDLHDNHVKSIKQHQDHDNDHILQGKVWQEFLHFHKINNNLQLWRSVWWRWALQTNHSPVIQRVRILQMSALLPEEQFC